MSESNLDKILTIAGKPGLFRMVAQTRTGVICYLTKRPKENCHQLGTTNQCFVRNQGVWIKG